MQLEYETTLQQDQYLISIASDLLPYKNCAKCLPYGACDEGPGHEVLIVGCDTGKKQ